MKYKIPEHYERNGLFKKKIKEQIKEIPDLVLVKARKNSSYNINKASCESLKSMNQSEVESMGGKK